MPVPFDFSPFVGLPWKECGRTADGTDCYGLVRLAYRAGLGIDLPSYDGEYAGTADVDALNALIAGERAPWRRVDRHKPFDLVLLHERPWHFGIVVAPGRMLHMPVGKTSVVEQYTTGRHACRVEGVYRHASQP